MKTKGYMNSTASNIGSWRDSKRRSWCNGGFRQALPATLTSIFKKFDCITGNQSNTTPYGPNITTQDYFTLAAEQEIWNGHSYSTYTETSALTQFTWYATSSNRVKNVSGSAAGWWERSPRYDVATGFCCATYWGALNVEDAYDTLGISPFGCL